MLHRTKKRYLNIHLVAMVYSELMSNPSAHCRLDPLRIITLAVPIQENMKG
ncbi:hypothetical protein FHS72_000586 [Loktanella ponticola]|uniref:Uncharacterized protein n=1 Tax=Yoonia ponticola TaxID=1524255 RepID=A0A7W9EWR9_9RHOB|nr:hypothetical protein [Yoonia ponticola]MBB5720982.1 hypothetical protein [Yoonia ponticola]